MKKKKEKLDVTSKTVTTSKPVSECLGDCRDCPDHPIRAPISKLELDLGRGDLNTLRDKLNEIIEKLNER